MDYTDMRDMQLSGGTDDGINDHIDDHENKKREIRYS